MNTAALALFCVYALLGLTACGKSPAQPSPETPSALFADPGLEAAVLDALGPRPPTKTNLLALTVLDASQRRIENLGGIDRLANLADLDLSANQISNLGPLAPLRRLAYLDLSDNAISDIAPLARLDSLVLLDLSHNAIIDLTPLRGLQLLETLGLIANEVAVLDPLLDLPALAHLDLEGNPLIASARDTQLDALRQRGLTVNWRTPAAPDGTADDAPLYELAVVARLADGRQEIYLVDPAGAPPANLTRRPGFYGRLRLAPDGTRLTFSGRYTLDGLGNHIYALDLSGGDLQRLTERPNRRPAEPAWSPDADRLAYTRQVSDTERQVFVYDLASGQRNALAATGPWATAPAWSPDGQLIAYIQPLSLSERRLALASADGAISRDLSGDLGGFARSFFWLPDGDLVLCLAGGPDDPKGAELYRIDPDTGTHQNLTRTFGHDLFPTLAPTADRIAFLSFRGPEGLFSLDLQSQTVNLLVDGAPFTNIGPPQWSPNGRHLAFSENPGRLHIADLSTGQTHQPNLYNLTLPDYPVYTWVPRQK